MKNHEDKTIEDIPALPQQENISSLFHKAVCQYQLGHLAEADTIIRRILKVNPDHTDANYFLGVIAGQLGQYDLACQLTIKAINGNPHEPKYYNTLGVSMQRKGHLEESLKAFERSIALKPDFADAYNNRGNLLHSMGRLEDSLADYEKTIQIQPTYAQAHNNRGVALRELGRLEEALAACEQATKIQPAYANAHKNKGIILSEIGCVEEARLSYLHALDAKPDYPEVYRLITLIQKTTPNNNLVAKMENLCNSPNTTPDSRMHLCYGLGKAYNDLKDYSQASHCYTEANRLKRNTLDYSLDKDIKSAEFLRELFSPKFVAHHTNTGIADDSPIFIVGMPRSGTTLLEHILASHPKVVGAGELPFIGQLACQGETNPDQNNLAWMREASDGILQIKGGEYIQELRRRGGMEAHFIIDKMPNNFWHVGFIRLILPKARIIHIRRNPCDTCFSIFTNYFMGNIPYAYELIELGGYYRLYLSLMKHWDTVFPGAIYDISYEDLVMNLEGEVLRLLDYCELPFDERCLNFHKTQRTIHTASFAQVRQPIYQSSVGRWRHYKDILQPLLSELGESQQHSKH